MAGQQMSGPEQPDPDKRENQQGREQGEREELSLPPPPTPGEEPLPAKPDGGPPEDNTAAKGRAEVPLEDDPAYQVLQAHFLAKKLKRERDSLRVRDEDNSLPVPDELDDENLTTIEEAYDRLMEIRERTDQSQAPPVDHVLLTKLIDRQLDEKEGRRVKMLLCKYHTWEEAALKIIRSRRAEEN